MFADNKVEASIYAKLFLKTTRMSIGEGKHGNRSTECRSGKGDCMTAINEVVIRRIVIEAVYEILRVVSGPHAYRQKTVTSIMRTLSMCGS